MQGAVKQIEKGLSPYPPVEGLPQLRALAVDWVNTTCHTSFHKENVLVTCGGKFALFAILESLLEQNQTVLIIAPYWVSYPSLVKMAGGIPKVISTHAAKKWKITPQDLIEHHSVETKALIFNSACNPTGTVYTKEEVAAILRTASELGLMVISDEVYSGLVFEEEFVSCGSFPEYRENVMIVQSCSKNFAMAGWRVGFAFGPESIIELLARVQSQTTTSTPLASQWAAISALENAGVVNSYVKQAMRARRDIFVSTYNSLFSTPIETPKSALYAFLSMSSLGLPQEVSSGSFCKELISKDNLAVALELLLEMKSMCALPIQKLKTKFKKDYMCCNLQLNQLGEKNHESLSC